MNQIFARTRLFCCDLLRGKIGLNTDPTHELTRRELLGDNEEAFFDSLLALAEGNLPLKILLVQLAAQPSAPESLRDLAPSFRFEVLAETVAMAGLALQPGKSLFVGPRELIRMLDVDQWQVCGRVWADFGEACSVAAQTLDGDLGLTSDLHIR